MTWCVWDSDTVPSGEIEIAADALRALWESPETTRAVKETGYGPSFAYQARLVLEAAEKVRGKLFVYPSTACGAN